MQYEHSQYQWTLSHVRMLVFLGELLRLHRGSMNIRKKALFCWEWPERSCREFSSLWADWKYNHSQKCVWWISTDGVSAEWTKRWKMERKLEAKREHEWTQGLMRLDRTTSLSRAGLQHDLSDTRGHGDDGKRLNYKRKKKLSKEKNI